MEDTGKEEGRDMGRHRGDRNQDGLCSDGVSEPQGSTWMDRNGLI